ncbi:MAG TPA: alpha/beta hydrolase [Acidimicrobiales bacterium]|nr:alpha/beta hydrolase [Acidimicrobiales bacterium]
MNYNEVLIDTPDGRTLEVATLGEPTGHTVLFHHGTPSSASLVKMLAPLVVDGSLYLVTTSRAGYGESSRLEGRDVASVVRDSRTALDSLGRSDYVVVGWSGGGPHALACAALDAPRCLAAFSLAGVVPANLDFDWTEGMGPENVKEFALAKEGGPEYEAHMASYGDAFAVATKDNIVELFGELLSEPDKAALEPELAREEFAASMRQGFEFGWRGFFDDDQAMMKDWGFDLTMITVPVDVWFGDQDLMVPRTHGEWLATNLPTATKRFFAGDGHVSVVVNHLDELASAIKESYA